MTVSTSEVADYLRQKETDEPIPLKSRERVLNDMAEGIKKNKPLSGGRCGFCGRLDEKLMPIAMRVDFNCAKKFMQKAGELNVTNRTTVDFHCDYCFARSFEAISINPKICGNCVKRVGRTHKFELKDMKKAEQKIEQEKQKAYGV